MPNSSDVKLLALLAVTLPLGVFSVKMCIRDRGGMRMNLPTGSVVSGVFVTSDSKDQVLAFYKSKLGSEASVFDAANSAMISLRKGSHENIMVSISSQQSQNEGKTKISIVHTKNSHS